MATRMAVSTAAYYDHHKVIITWDDTGTVEPANFYAWRIKITNLETGVVRSIDDNTWGVHSVTDRFAPNNIPSHYERYMVTTDTNNNQVETDQNDGVTVTPAGDDYWLIHPTDDSQTVRLFLVSGDSYSTEHENTVLNLIGRGRKVDRGERWGISGSLTAQLRERAGMTARQQKIVLDELREQAVALILQTPFGDSWQVALMDIQWERQAGSGPLEHINATIPYQEVA